MVYDVCSIEAEELLFARSKTRRERDRRRVGGLGEQNATNEGGQEKRNRGWGCSEEGQLRMAKAWAAAAAAEVVVSA
jgi:hypothetical protein